MKFSMTGQTGDLLIQVTTWTGLTVYTSPELNIWP